MRFFVMSPNVASNLIDGLVQFVTMGTPLCRSFFPFVLHAFPNKSKTPPNASEPLADNLVVSYGLLRRYPLADFPRIPDLLRESGSTSVMEEKWLRSKPMAEKSVQTCLFQRRQDALVEEFLVRIGIVNLLGIDDDETAFEQT